MRSLLPVALAGDYSVNAFACGWHERDAVVAVTRGALDYLARDELQGLGAHKFCRIRKGDTRLNLRLAGMVLTLDMIFNLGKTMRETGDLRQCLVLIRLGFAIKMVCSRGRACTQGCGIAPAGVFSRCQGFVQFTRSNDGLGGVLR